MHKKLTEIEKHPKQDFQVERIAFFSDAVFAIAITLLVIDFKFPHISKESTFESVCTDLLALRSHFVALLLSFVLIATYWMQHHFLFKHLHNYNNRMIIANIFVLLPIVFFPFTTAFLAESSENENVIVLPLRVFLINNFFAGFLIYYFYWLIFKKYKGMTYEITPREKFKFNMENLFKTSMLLIIFILILFTSQIKIIFVVTLILFGLMKLLNIYGEKKNYG
ncbi:TMEM175 family protein [Chryseobacterium sp. HMWF035]|uniref:TMEM175 family protein n=1 Tax=Chryseobacterium sp. HMWF035 TaxID=2056868 RepID=UPI001886A454|nr:TMEM175 family protein [Chryseobacterium sp. HMWF035]